jgi:hypothetical protein
MYSQSISPLVGSLQVIHSLKKTAHVRFQVHEQPFDTRLYRSRLQRSCGMSSQLLHVDALFSMVWQVSPGSPGMHTAIEAPHIVEKSLNLGSMNSLT